MPKDRNSMAGDSGSMDEPPRSMHGTAPDKPKPGPMMPENHLKMDKAPDLRSECRRMLHEAGVKRPREGKDQAAVRRAVACGDPFAGACRQVLAQASRTAASK